MHQTLQNMVKSQDNWDPGSLRGHGRRLRSPTSALYELDRSAFHTTCCGETKESALEDGERTLPAGRPEVGFEVSGVGPWTKILKYQFAPGKPWIRLTSEPSLKLLGSQPRSGAAKLSKTLFASTSEPLRFRALRPPARIIDKPSK